jgi:hypothetical protein
MTTRRIFCSLMIVMVVNLSLGPNLFSAESDHGAVLSGELKRWHKTTLTFDGPETSESATPNPFLDYRLDVTFTMDDRSFLVPGYFAADGDAANTSADTGNKWRVNFTPDAIGTWSWTASFRTGAGVAIDNNPLAGDSAGFFDGATGTFSIDASDKTGDDFRADPKGRLEYVGEHALRWRGGDGYFFKAGLNHPEVFLEYEDFDNTASTRSYSAHVDAWQIGDPLWQETKGTGIIGAINYLASEEMNVQYFIVMNSRGDGQNAFPWNASEDVWSYDISKLEQWQIVMDHMMSRGVMAHILLTEQENQSLFEYLAGWPSGGFADSRKLFFREMVARFGHLNALTWNIGEESGLHKNSTYGKAVVDSQRKDFADWLRNLTHYEDHIVVHNGGFGNDAIFFPLVGHDSLTGPSFQGHYTDPAHGHDRIKHWRIASAAYGHKWVVTYDEPYFEGIPDRDTWRRNSLWPSLLAGSAGIEFYSMLDQALEDYTTFSSFYADLRIASQFLRDNAIPFQAMIPDDTLVSVGWCLAAPGHSYVVYLSSGGTAELNVANGSYQVFWLDPRNGGPFLDGTVATITGAGSHSLGEPPNSPSEDWVVYVRNIENVPLYSLSVGSGTGSATYAAGALASITANTPPTGQEFDQWTGDTEHLSDVSAAATSVTMPAADVTVSATYKDVPPPLLYSLTVNSGLGSGNYTAGSTVNIVAAAAPTGQEFDQWIGDTEHLSNVSAAATSLTMPATDVTVSATYRTASVGTLSFQPTDDAYLQGTTRFNDNYLKVEAGYRVSYLKFSVSGLSGTVQNATLRLRENGDIGNGTLRAHRGSHNNWTETTLSAANAPLENGQVGAFTGAINAGQIVNIDITPLITGNGTYSVILHMDPGGNDVWFGSDESTRKPQLFIETTAEDTVTYSLTVNNGLGSGSYDAGSTVDIDAQASPAGQEFDQWIGDTEHLSDVNAASTSLTMPAADVTVTATYRTVTGGASSFQPTDDAYLQGTTRFNDNYLKVEAGYRVSYLKFSVSGLSGTVQNATLRLRENGDIGNGTLRAHRGSHNNWTETTLSAANAPLENGQVGVFTGAINAGQIVNIDITPLISGNGTYSVILKKDPGGNDVWFGSDESTRKPQLIIETSTGGTITYSLTVNSGLGSGNYIAGSTVNIVAAAAPTGQEFDQWTGDTEHLSDVSMASTSVTMPATDVTVTATFKDATPPVWYSLTVNSGLGSGNYTAGSTVNIVAAAAPTGQEFDQWTGDTEHLSDVSTASTSVTMPATDVTVTATYKDATPPVLYSLIVNSGLGSGNYTAGSTVNIVAAAAPTDQEFDQWTGDTEHLSDASAAATSVTMPATDVTVTATYRTASVGTLSFQPTDDAYLQGTTRFNDNYLKVEAGYRVSYLKFSVSGLSGTVQNATLRLQENGDPGTGTLRVFRGSHNNWTETTLSIANAPLGTGQLGSFTGTVVSGQIVSIDITPLITGNGTYSVILMKDVGGNDIWFGSQESPRKPQLVIETTGGGTASYSLTVNGGTGSGNYTAGSTVNIVAAAAPAGQEFDRWIGNTEHLSDVSAAATSVTMPAADVTVTATYRTVTGGASSFQPTDDAYLQGTTRFNDNYLKVEAGYRVSY